MNEYQNENFSNLINILALGIGLQNLLENEQQTAYNDVHAANDKQAEFLLGEIRKMIDEQNRRLERQDVILERIEKILERAINE